VWMALRYHGLAGYRASIERDIALADTLAASLRAAPDFELFEPRSLSIVCFRYLANRSDDLPNIDALNRTLLEQVQLGGRAFLSSTVIHGRFWLRACLVNPRSSESGVLSLLEVLREAAVGIT